MFSGSETEKDIKKVPRLGIEPRTRRFSVKTAVFLFTAFHLVMDELNINDYLQEFLDERSAQNLADETLRMYSVHVNLFLSLLHITDA